MSVAQPVAAIYQEARDDVYDYLLSFGLSPEQAQDTTQDVFLKLHAALQQGEQIRNPRAWAFKVAHNLGLNARARAASTKHEEIEDMADLADRQQPTAEQTLLDKERLTRIHDGLNSLSPQQRRSLYLRAEGLRYQEIAQVMGVSLSTVSEYVTRAITRLRKVVA